MPRSSAELRQIAQECAKQASQLRLIQRQVDRLGGAVQHEIGGTAIGADKKMLGLAGSAHRKLLAATGAFANAQRAVMRAAQEAAEREAEERRQRAQQAARR